MFKKLMRNKKAQQTAEYAILIALVVGAVIAMQTYAQRTIQARIRGASQYLSRSGGQGTEYLGTELQYEPYYTSSSYAVTRDETTNEEAIGTTTLSKGMGTTRTRASGGMTVTTWNGAAGW